MLREIEKAAADLANARAGWVTRRDAADRLGQVAEDALRALLARRQEKDVDVKSAVDRALGRVSAALTGVPAKAGYALDELAQACAKEGQRTVESDGDGYRVVVQTSGRRRQTVNIRRIECARGTLVTVSTECGTPNEDSLAWAVRANADLSLSALAIVKEDGRERLVLRCQLIAAEATPLEVKAAVKEIAYYGDWIEQKLMGSDDRR